MESEQQDTTTDRALRLLMLLRVAGLQARPRSTVELALELELSVTQTRYVLLWLEREGDVERVGHDGRAAIWRIPDARRT